MLATAFASAHVCDWELPHRLSVKHVSLSLSFSVASQSRSLRHAKPALPLENLLHTLREGDLHIYE